MSRLYRKKRSDAALLPTISLTPLIDTVLVLLVIFMVTTPGKTVTPFSDHADGKKMQESKLSVSLVEIDQHAGLYFNSQRIQRAHLLEKVKGLSRGKETINIFFHSHPGASVGMVNDVLNELRQIEHVGIIVG